MKTSLQKIQDSYINLGYKGEKLRKALENDKEYQKILEKRREKLGKINSKYVLSTEQDIEIFKKTEKLEKLNLSEDDRKTVELIKSQLEQEWRKHLIKELENLIQKNL